ncbi:MAG TPA: hypothetical protein VFA50_01770 [Stellaceae bacterium]|nr:hypothetical protein [Stellaceae bacterium]
MTRTQFLLILGVALGAIGGAGSARADVIDGDWCSLDGRQFSIKGPQIVTPAGTRTEGDYSRHYFTYVVPPGEKEAGATVSMTLVNENTVHLRRGDAGGSGSSAASGAVEVWKRCSAAVS